MAMASLRSLLTRPMGRTTPTHFIKSLIHLPNQYSSHQTRTMTTSPIVRVVLSKNPFLISRPREAQIYYVDDIKKLILFRLDYPGADPKMGFSAWAENNALFYEVETFTGEVYKFSIEWTGSTGSFRFDGENIVCKLKNGVLTALVPFK